MATNVQKMIYSYVEAWNGGNLNDFTTAFASVLAENATYIDPSYENLTGVDAIANLALKSLEKSPGRKFGVLIEPESHHNVGRYTWRSIYPDGRSSEGFDYFEFDGNFKITRIVSFF